MSFHSELIELFKSKRGIYLTEIYFIQVCRDRYFDRIIAKANHAFSGIIKVNCRLVDEGYFTDFNLMWPACIENYDIKSEWMLDAVVGLSALAPSERRGALDWLGTRSEEDRKAFSAVQRAEAAVLKPYQELMAALRSGEIRAYGREPGETERAPVPSTVWSNPTTRIDFRTGSLHICVHASAQAIASDPSAGAVWQEKLHQLWLDVDLWWPDEVEEEPPVLPTKARTGPKQSILWDLGFQHLVLELCDKDLPLSGRQLSEMMERCFSKMRHEDGRRAKVPSLSSLDREIRERWPEVWRAAQVKGKRLI